MNLHMIDTFMVGESSSTWMPGMWAVQERFSDKSPLVGAVTAYLDVLVTPWPESTTSTCVSSSSTVPRLSPAHQVQVMLAAGKDSATEQEYSNTPPGVPSLGPCRLTVSGGSGHNIIVFIKCCI